MGKAHGYVYMLQCVATGEMRVIKNEYDYRFLNTLVGARSMLVPITPRLGAFVDPTQRAEVNGMITTPMMMQPRRLIVRGKFVILAFNNGQPDNLSECDILKFKKLYAPYVTPKVIEPRSPNTVESLPWSPEATNEL